MTISWTRNYDGGNKEILLEQCLTIWSLQRSWRKWEEDGSWEYILWKWNGHLTVSKVVSGISSLSLFRWQRKWNNNTGMKLVNIITKLYLALNYLWLWLVAALWESLAWPTENTVWESSWIQDKKGFKFILF